MFVIFKSWFNVHGSLEDHFLVIRILWLNKVITYLLTYLLTVTDDDVFFELTAKTCPVRFI